MSLVVNPYSYFTDTNGNALNGYLYVGEVGKNAENYPIAIFYDNLFTTPAPNPLTVSAGYIYNSGTIAQIYASVDYSIVVKKTDGSLVYSSLNETGMTNGAIANIDELKDFVAPYDNYALNVLGYSEAGDGGGGVFYYDANSTEDDNGGTIIEPTSGSGRWIRQYSGAVNVKWFGAQGDGITDDTTALQNAINFATVGGNTVFFDSGAYNTSYINSYTNVILVGNGPEITIINIEGSADSVGINIAFVDGDFNYGGVCNMTIRNSGINGATGIKTPINSSAFNLATRYVFDSIEFRGAGWGVYLDIGDTVQGTVRNCEWRGSYDPKNDDSGQFQSVGIRLSAATGNIGVTMSALQMVNIRTGIIISDNCEGFSLTDTELVNGYSGIYIASSTSKPGGFIDGVHINCNREAINIKNRRDLHIGNVQTYRSDAYYDHADIWRAILIENSSRVTINTLLIRVVGAFPNASDIYGVSLNNVNKVSIDKVVFAEVGNVRKAFDMFNASNIIIEAINFDSIDTWFILSGTTSNISVKQISNSGLLPSLPLVIGVGVSRNHIQLPQEVSGVQKYLENNYATNTYIVANPRISPKCAKISSVHQSSPYVVNITLDKDSAVTGDEFFYRITMLASSNGTINFINGSGGSNLASIATNGSTQMLVFKFIFNGAGWVIDYQISSII